MAWGICLDHLQPPLCDGRVTLSKFTELGERERARFNQGLERQAYNRFFSHCDYFYKRWRSSLVKEMMRYAEGRKVLELGCTTWRTWLADHSIIPGSLTCINISEVELQSGIDLHAGGGGGSKIKPQFLLMDAHDLRFEDESFDLVFGSGILHHLSLVQGLDEIYRVLKPNGKIVFFEPLARNPVAKLVRALTKKARTEDEQPLRAGDMDEITQRFEVQFFHEQFLSVPAGVLSRVFFKDRDNPLMRCAYRADRFLDSNFAWMRSWFRNIIIAGERKAHVDK